MSPGSVTAATQARYADDYNGDGYRDYAVGDGDSVTVTYGTATGPGTTSKRFTQNSAGIPGTSGDAGGYGDGFGRSLANADLNRDGYADLVIGDRSERVSGKTAAGAVTIMWGARAGLGAKATRIPVTANSYYGFGTALATGDFNGDGKPDLAVADGVGTVYIYRGGIGPAGTTGRVTKHDHRDLGETTALVAGKVTRNNATDLYVLGQGYRGDDGMTQAAWFLRGGATITSGRLTTYNNSQPDYGPTGVIADFDRNGYGDLAVSDVPHSKSAGSVVILRGSATGPVSTYSRLTQATSGVATDATKGDAFGYSLSMRRHEPRRLPGPRGQRRVGEGRLGRGRRWRSHPARQQERSDRRGFQVVHAGHGGRTGQPWPVPDVRPRRPPARHRPGRRRGPADLGAVRRHERTASVGGGEWHHGGSCE